MTRRGAIMLWLAVSTVVIAALSVTGHAALHARARAVAGLDELRLSAEQSRQLLALRQTATPDAGALESVAGLTPRLSAAVAACGLPASVLAAVSPLADTSAPLENGLRTVHRCATVSLGTISLQQAGRFLDAWRQREPRWIISSIDLAPESTSSAAGTAGGDLPLRITLTVESISVEQQPSSPPSPAPGAKR